MVKYSFPKLTFIRTPAKRKIWRVDIRCTDPDTGQRRLFQYRMNINSERTEEEKIARGNSWVTLFAGYLKDGWNPFEQTPEQWVKSTTTGFIDKNKNLGQVLQECYDIKIQQITSNETLRTYKYIFKHFQAWLEHYGLDKKRPYDFTVQNAMLYADTLIKEGKKGRGFNNYRSVLKVYFNMMVEREIILSNPFNKIKPAKTTEATITPFSDMELQAIRAYLKEHDYNMYVFTQVIFYTFLRPVEILHLQVKHLDLTRGKINLPASASKNRKSRSCNIPPALMKIFKEWLKYDSVNDWLFGPDMKTGSGKAMRRTSVTRRHAKALEACELEGDYSLYAYKYNGVISASIAGISIEEIREQAGHSSVNMTQIYLKKLGLLKPNSFGSVDY